MRSEEVLLKADDDVDLFVRRCEPDAGPTDRTLFLVHGMSEHGRRYEHVAHAAAGRGWNVVVADLRGHGLSGGEHTHVADFSEYVADLKRIFDWAGLRPESTVLAGHSMGGLVSARFVERFPNRVSALAMLSPLLAVSVEISPLTIALGKVLSLVRPQSRFQSRVAIEHTTRNPAVLALRAADPLIRRSVTAAWYFAMQAALRHVWEQAENITCPVLILQAGADRIVDPNAAQPWLERVGSPDKTLRIVPDHYHELLNEIDWMETLTGLLDWFEPRIAASGSRSDIPVVASEESPAVV